MLDKVQQNNLNISGGLSCFRLKGSGNMKLILEACGSPSIDFLFTNMLMLNFRMLMSSLKAIFIG